MFRVPSDPHNPSFDATFKVGFWRWLLSNKHDRVEWMRRRNAAAKLAQRNQAERAKAWAERKIAEKEARRRTR